MEYKTLTYWSGDNFAEGVAQMIREGWHVTYIFESDGITIKSSYGPTSSISNYWIGTFARKIKELEGGRTVVMKPNEPRLGDAG